VRGSAAGLYTRVVDAPTNEEHNAAAPVLARRRGERFTAGGAPRASAIPVSAIRQQPQLQTQVEPSGVEPHGTVMAGLMGGRVNFAMMSEMYAKRLRAAGHTTPVPIAWMHGWKENDRIGHLLTESGLFRIHDLQAVGTGFASFYQNRLAVGVVALGLLYVYLFFYYSYWLLLAAPLVFEGFKRMEAKCVFDVVDQDIDKAHQLIRDETPSLVLGNQYGGAIATFLLQHRCERARRANFIRPVST
jgi:hypothetical protein